MFANPNQFRAAVASAAIAIAPSPARLLDTNFGLSTNPREESSTATQPEKTGTATLLPKDIQPFARDFARWGDMDEKGNPVVSDARVREIKDSLARQLNVAPTELVVRVDAKNGSFETIITGRDRYLPLAGFTVEMSAPGTTSAPKVTALSNAALQLRGLGSIIDDNASTFEQWNNVGGAERQRVTNTLHELLKINPDQQLSITTGRGRGTTSVTLSIAERDSVRVLKTTLDRGSVGPIKEEQVELPAAPSGASARTNFRPATDAEGLRTNLTALYEAHKLQIEKDYSVVPGIQGAELRRARDQEIKAALVEALGLPPDAKLDVSIQKGKVAATARAGLQLLADVAIESGVPTINYSVTTSGYPRAVNPTSSWLAGKELGLDSETIIPPKIRAAIDRNSTHVVNAIDKEWKTLSGWNAAYPDPQLTPEQKEATLKGLVAAFKEPWGATSVVIGQGPTDVDMVVLKGDTPVLMVKGKHLDDGRVIFSQYVDTTITPLDFAKQVQDRYKSAPTDPLETRLGNAARVLNDGASPLALSTQYPALLDDRARQLLKSGLQDALALPEGSEIAIKVSNDRDGRAVAEVTAVHGFEQLIKFEFALNSSFFPKVISSEMDPSLGKVPAPSWWYNPNATGTERLGAVKL